MYTFPGKPRANIIFIALNIIEHQSTSYITSNIELYIYIIFILIHVFMCKRIAVAVPVSAGNALIELSEKQKWANITGNPW